MITLIIAIAVAIFSVLAGYFLRRYIAEKKIQDANARAKLIIDQAAKEASDKKREAELEAKDLLFRMRQDFEQKTTDRRQEIFNLEKRLSQKEENIDRRLDLLEKKEKELESKLDTIKKQEEALRSKEAHLHSLIAEEKERLQKIASLSAEEAKQILLNRLNEELNAEKSVLIKTR